MDRAEALRSIRFELVEYIQKKTRVDFDNTMQAPVHFIHKGKSCFVGEVFGRFKTRKNHHAMGYLVKTDDDEVYFLYFDRHGKNLSIPFNRGFWVLSFRILGDKELTALYLEERRMLINMTFKRVVDFHGHLCPDLVLGGKVCEYAQKLLSENSEVGKGISIIAENCTSALDAIQVLLGATIGNQRLQVMDFGKHNYTLLFKNGKSGLRLVLKHRYYGDEDEYQMLEQKMLYNQIVLNEVVQFQHLLDNRAKQLLILSPEDLFDGERVKAIQQPAERASVYVTCCKCKEHVLKGRSIERMDNVYCMPCFQMINAACKYHNRH